MSLLRAAVLLPAAPVWVAALCLAPLAAAQEPAAGPPPLAHLIPADAVGGMTLDVGRLRADPVFARAAAPLFGRRGPLSEPLEELGLSFEEVEAVAAYLPPAPPADPDDRFPSREPFGQPVIFVRAAGPVAVPERLADRGTARALPDGRTLAVALGRRGGDALADLGEPIAPADGSAAAAAEALAADGPAALTAFGDVTAVRAAMLHELDFAARREDEWALAFGLARPAVTDATGYALAADLTDGALTARLVALCPDAAAAGRLRRTAEAAVTIAGNVAEGLPGAMLRREPDDAAVVLLVANAARGVLDSVAVRGGDADGADAARVVVEATADAAVTAAAADLLAGAAREEFGRRPRRPLPGETRRIDRALETAEEALDDADER